MSLSDGSGPSETSKNAAGPAHEIARVYEVLGADEDGMEGLDPRRLLSACWRATKESA